MPKKSRKMKERAAMRRATMSQSLGDAPAVTEATRTTLTPSARSYAAPTFDYTYIYKDLRRIAFFALFFFGVLIALSFVLK